MGDVVRPDEIEALVARFDASRCAELHLRFDGFELHLSNDRNAAVVVRDGTASAATAPRSAPSPSGSALATSPPAKPVKVENLEGFEIVRAPYLGTFYRAPKPGDPAYVELGSEVGVDSDLCLVEVMKLFTAVRAGVAGRIAKILATDGAMVEAGQPLFAIEPKS